ncbi:methyltransferase [Mycobacterium sp. URHB0021]
MHVDHDRAVTGRLVDLDDFGGLGAIEPGYLYCAHHGLPLVVPHHLTCSGAAPRRAVLIDVGVALGPHRGCCGTSCGAACRRILSNVRCAMNPGARLTIVEMMADTVTLEASLMDIAMMFAFTGQERDERHFESLLSAAGLRTSRTVALHHPYRLIEAA